MTWIGERENSEAERGNRDKYGICKFPFVARKHVLFFPGRGEGVRDLNVDGAGW